MSHCVIGLSLSEKKPITIRKHADMFCWYYQTSLVIQYLWSTVPSSHNLGCLGRHLVDKRKYAGNMAQFALLALHLTVSIIPLVGVCSLCSALTWPVGSFLLAAAWFGDDPEETCCDFPGVRRPCGSNVAKKFLEGVVAVVTTRWLDTKSLEK